MEVTQMYTTPDDEYLITCDSCLNYEYLRNDTPLTNSISLYNKTTFKKYCSFSLEKEEDPNVIFYCQKQGIVSQFTKGVP